MSLPPAGGHPESGQLNDIPMHQLPFTALLNHLFGAPVNDLLLALGVHVKHPTGPIPDHFAMQLLVVLGLIAFFIAVRVNLSVEDPGTLQNLMETFYSLVDAQSAEIIGHDSRRFLSYLITLALYILFCNLLGLIPFFESPTGVAVVPLGCAVVTWVFYQFHGFRENGIGYLKHFAGPVWWMAPLMFLIEVTSHFARILSLSVRLYANMFAGDMVTLVFFSLIPLGVPVIFMLLHFFVALVQTLIFVMLPMVYISEAVAHESH
jgi:F-type H+-transporting ATPase subunit a